MPACRFCHEATLLRHLFRYNLTKCYMPVVMPIYLYCHFFVYSIERPFAMADLPKNWPTDGPLDFEYQFYTLMAYLQSVEEHFNKQELYPALSKLLEHYRQLVKLQHEKQQINQALPKALKGIDFANLKLQYQVENLAEWVGVIDEILEQGMPRLQTSVKQGQVLFDELMQLLKISGVGVMPINRSEGYVLLQNGNSKLLGIYRYCYRTFSENGERFGSLQWELLEKQELSLLNTVDSLKMYLITQYKDLPNPATFWLRTAQPLPHEATLLPLAKRKILYTLTLNQAA